MEQAKPRNSQSFHERSLSTYFKRCCLRARLLIYQASKAAIFPSPGKVEDTSHTSFQPIPIIKPNYQELSRRSLYTHLRPKFYSSHLKNRSLDLLDLIACRTCIHTSHRTVANKQSLIGAEAPPLPSHTLWVYTLAQHGGNGEKCPSPIFFQIRT